MLDGRSWLTANQVLPQEPVEWRIAPLPFNTSRVSFSLLPILVARFNFADGQLVHGGSRLIAYPAI